MTNTNDIDEVIQQFRDLLTEHGYMVILWHIDDVQEIRPDLTEAQCREILKKCDRYLDAETGMNWDVIRSHADSLFPEPETDAEKER